MFKTILVAFDGSDHAQAALKIACGMSKTFEAALHIAHAPQIDTPPLVVGSYVGALSVPPTEEEIARAGNLIIEECTKLAAAEGVSDVKHHLGSGMPAAFALDVADEINADLIVMGRRGLGALGALALGSVSQQIAHKAKCACMTVV